MSDLDEPREYLPDSGMDLAKATIKENNAWARLPKAEIAIEQKKNNLDSPENKERHRRLVSWYQHELQLQAENRLQMQIDEDVYDNEQWDQTDAEELRRRGQVPIVYNVVAPTIDSIVNTEKRTRTQYKILPRRKDGSRPAERKTQLMKYLDDVNRSQFGTSRAFEDAVKVGVGWLEAGSQAGDDGEPVYDRYESWRNILWDSRSQEKDLSDARYLFRPKWVDLDVAAALFPKRTGLLHLSALDSGRQLVDSAFGDQAMDSLESYNGTMGYRSGDYFYFKRYRVRLIEMWYRAPAQVERIEGGEFSGMMFDPGYAPHAEEVASGRATVIARTQMRMHVALFTHKGLLWISQSPYRHNQFPFTPIWGYRRGRTGLPYGAIRRLRDIQMDINKRAAKSLHIISSNKTIMDEGAVPDLKEFAEEVARPDSIIVKKPGRELVINADRDLAPAHLELMSRNIAMIQSASGVTDEFMGRTTNAVSGIAIERRQAQGGLATQTFFDNLLFAMKVHGEKRLSLMEQYFTEEKRFRITNMRGIPEYVTVNDGLPENDIVRTKADFVISEDQWSATVRQAQTSEFMQMLTQLAPAAPQLVMLMLDLVIESMDIPNKDEIVSRIRQATGMRDPDAEEPTPEEVARAQEQNEQAQMQKAMMAATIAEKQASAEQKAAQARKTMADSDAQAQKIIAEMAGINVNTQKAALEAALAMVSAPAIAPVADGVLHESGFESRTEKEDAAMLAAAQQRKAMAEQAAQEQAAAQQQQMQPQQQPDPNQPQPMQPMV